jgi:hypothetical protein
MLRLKHSWELPPVAMSLSTGIQATIDQCARGESAPDDALMQLLVVSCSEQETERALGTAIWGALEDHNTGTADRLGAIQKLWDGARDLVHCAVPGPDEKRCNI